MAWNLSFEPGSFNGNSTSANYGNFIISSEDMLGTAI
jgi:hypothetical protein